MPSSIETMDLHILLALFAAMAGGFYLGWTGSWQPTNGDIMKKYYLVTDATADQVTRKTDLDAHQTHLGALVERPPPFNLDKALDDLDRAMHPNKPRCNCGPWSILHRPNCPLGMAIT